MNNINNKICKLTSKFADFCIHICYLIGSFYHVFLIIHCNKLSSVRCNACKKVNKQVSKQV